MISLRQSWLLWQAINLAGDTQVNPGSGPGDGEVFLGPLKLDLMNPSQAGSKSVRLAGG